MATFIDWYRGAAIYEVEGITSSEGEVLGFKVIAEAKIPDQENLKVDFIEEGATQEEALEKIKKSVDTYLTDHNIDKFEKESL